MLVRSVLSHRARHHHLDPPILSVPRLFHYTLIRATSTRKRNDKYLISFIRGIFSESRYYFDFPSWRSRGSRLCAQLGIDLPLRAAASLLSSPLPHSLPLSPLTSGGEDTPSSTRPLCGWTARHTAVCRYRETPDI